MMGSSGRLPRATAILATGLLLGGFVQAADISVAPGDLAGAIAHASDGDVLELQPGVHPGPIFIERPITLRGQVGVVIAGDGTGDAVTILADGARLEALEVRGAGSDLAEDDAAILVREAKGVTIRGCLVRCRAFGIYLHAGEGHQVLDNTVIGDASLPSSSRGNGIHLWHTRDNEVRGNVLRDTRDGVYLSFAHENRITANRGASLRYGIHYMYSEQNLLEANHFERCTGGLALMYSKKNRLIRNISNDNRDFGILCLSLERSVIEGNETRHNGRGLFLENSHSNRFQGNAVVKNGVGVYLTAASEDNVFTENRFLENLVQVYQRRPELNRWHDECRGNRWSDYLGADWNRDGIGDAPYQLSQSAANLMAHRPATRWLWMSPALMFLDWWDGVGEVPGRTVDDPFPLVGERAVP